MTPSLFFSSNSTNSTTNNSTRPHPYQPISTGTNINAYSHNKDTSRDGRHLKRTNKSIMRTAARRGGALDRGLHHATSAGASSGGINNNNTTNTSASNWKLCLILMPILLLLVISVTIILMTSSSSSTSSTSHNNPIPPTKYQSFFDMMGRGVPEETQRENSYLGMDWGEWVLRYGSRSQQQQLQQQLQQQEASQQQQQQKENQQHNQQESHSNNTTTTDTHHNTTVNHHNDSSPLHHNESDSSSSSSSTIKTPQHHLPHFPWLTGTISKKESQSHQQTSSSQQQQQQHSSTIPSPKLIVTTMLLSSNRNIHARLIQWIEFHLMQQVDLIVIFHYGAPSEAQQQIHSLLKPYIQRKTVDYIRFPLEYRLLERFAEKDGMWSFLSSDASSPQTGESVYKDWRQKCLALESCERETGWLQKQSSLDISVGDNAKTADASLRQCLQSKKLLHLIASQLGHKISTILKESCEKFAFNLLLNLYRKSYPDAWMTFIDVNEFMFVSSGEANNDDEHGEASVPSLKNVFSTLSNTTHLVTVNPVAYEAATLYLPSSEFLVEKYVRHASKETMRQCREASTATVQFDGIEYHKNAPHSDLILSKEYCEPKYWVRLGNCVAISEKGVLVTATGDKHQEEKTTAKEASEKQQPKMDARISLNRYIPEKQPVQDTVKQEQLSREHQLLTECTCKRSIPLLPQLLQRLHVKRNARVSTKDLKCPSKCVE